MMAEKPLYSEDKDPLMEGEIRITIPDVTHIDRLSVKLNDDKNYLAALLDEDFHYTKERALVIRNIIEQVQIDIENGTTTRKSLEALGNGGILKQISYLLAASFTYGQRRATQLNRAQLIKLAAFVVDAITIYDIHTGEQEENPDA